MRNNILKKWFVLYTKSRHELRVLSHLSSLEIEAYTPTKIEFREWSDRRKKIEIALLPSMVLVFLKHSEINKVFEVPGVRRYLFVHGERAIVSNNEVLAMKNYVENAYGFSDKKNDLIGSKIEIPLLNQEVEILSVNGKRCFAQLKMLGASVSFQLK